MSRTLHPALAGLLSALAALLLTGCPPTGPDGNNPGRALTDAEKTAVTDVVTGLLSTVRFGATLAPLRAAELNFETLQLFAQFGTCPQVTSLATATNAAIRIDFGAGCTAAALANETVRGAVDLTVDRVARSAAATLNGLVIGAAPFSGTAGFNVTRSATGTVSLNGALDLTIAGIGAANGIVLIELSAGGELTLSANSLTLTTPGGAAYSVALTNVRSDPAGNGNLRPEQGSATISLDGVSIVITFDAGSPGDAAVAVRVGTAAAVDFTVPGF